LKFSIATRDELWLDGRLFERRLSHGEAVDSEHGIHASDTRDAALVAACDAAMDELHAFVVPDARIRLIAEASSVDGVMRTITVTSGNCSIVTTPEFFADDAALLRGTLQARAAPHPSPLPTAMNLRRGEGTRFLDDVPYLWKHGAAAVLLHEAIGHPLEHGQPAIELPPWLIVDVPLKQRRASFKDVPLLRMTEVVARQHGAPFAIPEQRVEIELVDGGAYDPLTGMVTLRIAAATLVDGDRIDALAPFTIHETRESIVRSIAGAAGEPLRYPGVICSREGQELVVGSYAPLMLTELR
jgi:hypothetical protein